MRALDRDIHLSRALVVDGNATSRSILVAQLRDFGVGTVVPCGRIVDARSQLEIKTFDVVLCEHSFQGNDGSGQQLLDDLRRHQLLPLSTVFIMITSEASYAKVSEAAESALDGYLLKPHTAMALGERLQHARRRKRVLREIFEAIDAGRFTEGAALCLKRFRERGDFWLFAGRIGGELLLHLRQHAQARELFEAILAAQPVPWAQLGVARAQLENNEAAAAARTLEALIAEHAGYADAYDVLGRLHAEQGDFEAAAAACRQAVSLTPGSTGRLQKLGMLAFYLGDEEEAVRTLERAVSTGIGSKMFDPQTLVLLALARFGQKDSKGLQRCADNLAHALSRAPESRRLQRFVQLVQVLGLVLRDKAAEAAERLREHAGELRDESFDVEAGCNLLSLVSRLAACGLQPEGAEEWVDAVGLRHGSSKALTDLLARATAPHEPFAERIRASHHRITHVAEQAMAYSLAGNPAAAVRGLLESGRASLNGKLIDNARLVLQRHHAKIDDAQALLDEADELRRRFCTGAGRLPLGDAGRKPGAMALRSAAMATAADGSRPGETAAAA